MNLLRGNLLILNEISTTCRPWDLGAEYPQQVRTYWKLFAIPGVKRLVISAIPGRIAYAMINLTTFFYVQHATGSITLAGLATGAETVTSSLTAGIRGQAIDKFGQTKPLLIYVPAWVSIVLLLSFQTEKASLLLVSALVGLCSPPINLSTRPLWRDAVGADNLRTAYAIDTTLMNATTVIGPVIATTVSLRFGGDVALRLTALLMLTGGLSLLTMPLSRNWKPEPTNGTSFALLKDLRFQLLALEGMIFGLGWGLLEIAIPSSATLAGVPAKSAPLLAALAGASIVGGLIIGGRKSAVTPLRGFKIASLCVAFTTIPLSFTTPGWSMGISLMFLGLAIGFAQVYHWEVLEAVRPVGSATSAQAWLWTVEGSMLAIGAALGGFLVEHVSPRAAFGGVTIGLICSTAFVWLVAAKHLSQADQPLSDIQKIEALADLETPHE